MFLASGALQKRVIYQDYCVKRTAAALGREDLLKQITLQRNINSNVFPVCAIWMQEYS